MWGFGFIFKRFFIVASNDDKFSLSDEWKDVRNLPQSDQFAHAIGFLTINWAVLETLVRAIFTCIATPNNPVHGDIIWLSTRMNKARLDLLCRCVEATDISPEYKEEISRIVKRFKAISRHRNFYAHTMYKTMDGQTLSSMETVDLLNDGKVFSSKTKDASPGTLNEIRQMTEACNKLNREAHPFLQHLRPERGALLLDLPKLPGGYPNNPKFPALHTH